jgi:O-antigen ligase
MSGVAGSAGPSAVDAARRAAREHGGTLRGGLVVALSAGFALLMVGLFVLLDYQFDQDPHRLLKILIGVAGITAVLMRPLLGVLTLPVLTPFLPWLPKLPIPGVNALNVALFSVFFAFALPAVIRRQPVLKMGRIGGLLIGLVALAGVSIGRAVAFPTGLTYDAGDAGLQLFRAAMTFLTYFIGLAMTRDPRDRRRLAWAIVVGLIAESLVTILYGRSGRGGRAVGSIGQSNDLGAFLSMYAVLAGALWFGVRAWYARLPLVAAVAGAVFAILLSVSRGAIVSVAAGLLFVAARSSRAALAVLISVLISAPLWTPDYVKERIAGTQVEDETYDEVELESSSQLRVDTWAAITDIVTNHPIEGVGFNALGYVLPELGEARGVAVKDSAHSTYLRFVGEMGLIGLGLLLYLFYAVGRMAVDAMRAARDRWERQLGLGLLAATLVMAVNCAFGDRFYQITVSGNFWLLAAIVNNQLDGERGRA